MTHPDRVRCSPLGRRERIARVVDEEIVGDTRGPRVLYTVSVEGHRFRVHREDVEPV